LWIRNWANSANRIQRKKAGASALAFPILSRLLVDSAAPVSARVSTVLVLLRWLLMILLLRMGRVLVIGVAARIGRMVGALIVLGRILLGVLRKILLGGIRPVGIVLIGRAIGTRAGRPVILR
jgi:hypothetical protein